MFIGKPGVRKAGILMMSFRLGKGFDVYRLGVGELPKKDKRDDTRQRNKCFPKSAHNRIQDQFGCLK
ncbi:MAG: hypothetical protein IH577_04855 [Deltaproteobacteria bacterium]|nr:hypothetical protein [Deltaproteobacteria bacterium]